MECMRVRDINQEEKGMPIEIRVLRKWISRSKKEEICYQFVDAYGDAIEATAELQDKNYFDSIIKLHSCYRVSEYMCESPRYMATVEHGTSLVIGRRAKFQLLIESNIPTAYFNFTGHEKLKKRINVKRLLTDHIGRVGRNSLRTTSTGMTLRKVLLQDESREKVEITLWPEMQHLIGDEVISGDIIAITSATVSEHNELLQLELTYLTSVVINPTLPQTSDFVTRLKALPPMQPSKVNKKMVTVSKLSLDMPKKQGYTYFKCCAKVEEIKADRVWYYATCSKCSKKLYREKKGGQVKFVCKDDEDVTPNFMYCVNATITDGTGSTDVVLLNEGMHALINITCKGLVMKHIRHDSKALPDEMCRVIGITKVLHLTVKSDGKIVIHDVSDVSPRKATQPITSTLPPTTQPKTSILPSVLPPATPNPKVGNCKRASTEATGPVEEPKLKKA